MAISVVARLRFVVGFIVQPRHRPPDQRSLPPLTWPLTEKSCPPNATSVSKAAWLGQPSPMPAPRARWCPRACSLSARGGRCELDASPPIDGRRGLGVPPALGPLLRLTGCFRAHPSVRPSYTFPALRENQPTFRQYENV